MHSVHRLYEIGVRTVKTIWGPHNFAMYQVTEQKLVRI